MPVFEMTIDATIIWYDTGLVLDGTESVSIEVTSGTWTANPATGMVDANGHPGLVAKPEYSMAGELEGALVGRIGESGGATKIFLVGVGPTTLPKMAGALSLSINDDVHHIYGVGFPDNLGSVHVRISS